MRCRGREFDEITAVERQRLPRALASATATRRDRGTSMRTLPDSIVDFAYAAANASGRPVSAMRAVERHRAAIGDPARRSATERRGGAAFHQRQRNAAVRS